MATAQGIICGRHRQHGAARSASSRVQRGHDPRDYTLVAFGGAGPLHAARLARELEIRRVLVPRNPGILCAMGLLLTDLRADFAQTRLLPRDRRRRRRRGRGVRRARRSAPSAGSSTRASRPPSARARAHRRHALRRPELRAAGRAARRRRSRPPTHRRRWRRASSDAHQQHVRLRRRRRSRCSSSRSALEATAHGAQGRAHGASRRRRRTPAAAIVRAPRRLAAPRRATSCLPRSTTASALAPGQPLRRPGHRRADGRDDAGAARQTARSMPIST